MLFKGKFFEKKLPVPRADPPGEELETFLTVGSRRVVSLVEGDGSPEMIRRKIGKEIPEEKRIELECELSERVINLEALRRIAFSGQLDGGFRAVVWKLLLGYLPVERDAWEEALAVNRLRYSELKLELLMNPSETIGKADAIPSSSEQVRQAISGLLCRHEISNGNHPLNLDNSSIWCQYFKDGETVAQIERDLQRTHPDIAFFSGSSSLGKHNQKAMRNILLLFSKLNPAIGYVQGMNEILAPLYYVFSSDPDGPSSSNAEADSFACFVRLMSNSVDHFCQQLDDSPAGIHCTISHLSELLRANDKDLWQHLVISCKVNPLLYAFRWITLLLTQEFDLHSIMRIWDSLLSHHLGVQDMLLRVCCAMLLCVRHELFDGNFTSNLKLLQHYPQIDLEHLLNTAQQLTPIMLPCFRRSSSGFYA